MGLTNQPKSFLGTSAMINFALRWKGKCMEVYVSLATESMIAIITEKAQLIDYLSASKLCES